MIDISDLYYVRDYNPEVDKAFVLATFLRGLYYGNTFFKMIPKDIFMDNYKRVAEALIDGQRSIIKVACLKDDPDTILGYSILSIDFSTIHWVYVKSSETKIKGTAEKLTWRNKGIGKSLVPKYPLAYSHFTDTGLILVKKFDNCIFNPFAI